MLNKIQSGLFSCELVEITADEVLLDKYGLIIPVIQRTDTQEELKWPFNQKEIVKWLGVSG